MACPDESAHRYAGRKADRRDKARTFWQRHYKMKFKKEWLYILYSLDWRYFRSIATRGLDCGAIRSKRSSSISEEHEKISTVVCAKVIVLPPSSTECPVMALMGVNVRNRIRRFGNLALAIELECLRRPYVVWSAQWHMSGYRLHQARIGVQSMKNTRT